MKREKFRRYDIDNLRNLTILLLFPVHTFMIWNDFGSRFYVWVGENRILSTLIVLVNPWFMPLLFALAGMSARYALERRSAREFVRERIEKLFIPFVGGMIFFVPFQTLYARKYFDGYEGSLLDNWKYFFTHLTDFSGYDGGFTPGHLWFILFLFLISLVTLALFRFYPYERVKERVEKLSAFGVFLLFIPVWLMYYLGNFGGFSLGKSLALYLLGYYVLSNEAVMAKVEKNIKWIGGLWIVGTAALVLLYYYFSYYGDLWINYIGWNSILVLLVLGKKYLNRKTRFTVYFNGASYPVYILHQSILVAVAYYVVRMWDNLPMQAAAVCIGSFVLTVAAYHLIRMIPFVRKIVGIK